MHGLTRSAGATAMAATVAVLMLAGCSSSSGVTAQNAPAQPASTPESSAGATTPAPAPVTALSTPKAAASTPPRPPTTASATDAILSHYRAFFRSLTPLSTATAAVRVTTMRRLATDPELTRVLGGLEASRELGQVLFGQSVLRPRLVRVGGGMASLTDCQDTSMHGRMVAATGRKVTIGRRNDLAYTTMRRGADGIWRVAAVEYAPAGSCSA